MFTQNAVIGSISQNGRSAVPLCFCPLWRWSCYRRLRVSGSPLQKLQHIRHLLNGHVAFDTFRHQ